MLTGDFSGLVAYFNALETEMMDVFEEMKAAGMGFIGIHPYAAGLLTDKRVNHQQLHSAVAAVEKGPLDSSVVQQAHRLCTEFRKRFGVTANLGGVPVD